MDATDGGSFHMPLLLVDFPDERHGIDHLHVERDDLESIERYIAWFELVVGKYNHEVIGGPCPRCGGINGSHTRLNERSTSS